VDRHVCRPDQPAVVRVQGGEAVRRPVDHSPLSR
jgi:hypothetical protein